MKGLPESKIYEQGQFYWPYKKSLVKVLEIITSQTAKDCKLLDIMCGPGYLLGQISVKRGDLKLLGVDLDERYIFFSKEKFSDIDFEIGNILTWQPKQLFDVVICTGSIHHLPYEKQDLAIEKIAGMVKPAGLVIISDSHINDYANEKERKVAAAKLGYEYLIETIRNGAPDDVVATTIDILDNDVMMNEFKTSVKKRLLIFNKYFSNVEVIKTWPDIDSEYGDYIMVCTNNNKSNYE